MSSTKSTASASVNAGSDAAIDAGGDHYRMARYRALSAAFSYPAAGRIETILELMDGTSVEELQADYDRLFRTGTVWLYATEHQAPNEFERARLLSDIMGFYGAFGVEPSGDRPDSLSAMLEFMYLLIYKRLRAETGEVSPASGEQVEICREAEKRFFLECLNTPAVMIGEKIVKEGGRGFYSTPAVELLEFVESERTILGGSVS